MKKLPLIIAMLSMLILTGCRDIVNSYLDVFPPFDVPYTTTFSVPMAGVNTATYTKTPEIPINIDLDTAIKNNNPKYSINNVESVKLSTLRLTYVSSTTGVKMDAIKNARIYIKAPNLPEKLIATAYNNTNPDFISFSTPEEELLNYFKSAQNSLIIEIQGNTVTVDEITMKMSSGFKVRVQL